MEHDHAYLHEHGIAHTHEHNHEHDHTHPHVHENTKAVLNRLSRAIGHLQSVRKMVEDGRDCSEVLLSLIHICVFCGFARKKRFLLLDRNISA